MSVYDPTGSGNAHVDQIISGGRKQPRSISVKKKKGTPMAGKTRRNNQAASPGLAKGSQLPGGGADPTEPDQDDPPQGKPGGGNVAKKRGPSVNKNNTSKATKPLTRANGQTQATPRQKSMSETGVDLSQPTSTRQRAAAAAPVSARMRAQAATAARRAGK